MGRNRIGIVLGLVVALLALTGCSNSSSEFSNAYSEFFKESGYGLNSDLVQYRAEPARVVRGSGMDDQKIAQDRWAMWERGYGVIGRAAFNGSRSGTGDSLAVEQANKVGAAVVALYSEFDRTITGTTTTATPVTSTTVGPGGALYVTTSHVPQTSSYSIDRYHFLALYFARLKDIGLGVATSAPTGSEQQAFGTNKGMAVRAVRRGSAAHDAEILPGDLILRFDGASVAEDPPLRDLIDAARGRTVTVTILRPSKGQITKRVLIRGP